MVWDSRDYEEKKDSYLKGYPDSNPKPLGPNHEWISTSPKDRVVGHLPNGLARPKWLILQVVANPT